MTERPSHPPAAEGVVPVPPPLNEELTPAALQRLLRTAVFGHRVFYYPTIGSTNDRAHELAVAGEPEGALVLAETQTGGRGRRERSWTSPARLGIYASLILRPGVDACRAPLFTFMAAISVSEALREASGVEARIKWPNDVLVGRRKIGGILGETRGGEPRVKEIVLGMGINVNQSPGDFPVGLRDRATSVWIETGRNPGRPEILAALLGGFERRYGQVLRHGGADLLREWETLSALPSGSRVVVNGPGGRVEGAVAGVDEEGALLLRERGGGLLRVPFGEIVEPIWP